MSARTLAAVVVVLVVGAGILLAWIFGRALPPTSTDDSGAAAVSQSIVELASSTKSTTTPKAATSTAPTPAPIAVAPSAPSTYRAPFVSWVQGIPDLSWIPLNPNQFAALIPETASTPAYTAPTTTASSAPQAATSSIATSEPAFVPGPSSPTGTSSGGNSNNSTATTTPDAASLVTVDAGAALSLSGGNDLRNAQGLFRGAGYPESNGGLETSAPFLSAIGADTVRLINYEGGSSLDASSTFQASARMGFSLPWVKRYNYVPHIIVGQWRPDFLPDPASSWDQATWDTYEDYATKFVRYMATGFDGTGFPKVIFEVGNEVDITQQARDLWTLANPNVGQGDPTRYEHYLKVYAVWAKAVDQVARENQSETLLIGGPAMGGQSLFLNAGDLFHPHFISEVLAQGLRLDFVSLHYYGDPLHGWPGVAGSDVKTLVGSVRAALNASGKSSTPIFITEYGPSESSDASATINYDFRSAPWMTAFLTQAASGGASYGNIVVVRDNFGANTSGSPTVPSLNDIQNGVEQPKPVYNVDRLFSLLSGTRRSVTLPSAQSSLISFAATDSAQAGLILANYGLSYDASGPHDTSAATSVTPRFSSLPFSGDVTVDRYLIDEHTSVGGASLQKVESCKATVSSGGVTLPSRTLGPSAVSLWLVTPGAAASLAACS